MAYPAFILSGGVYGKSENIDTEQRPALVRGSRLHLSNLILWALGFAAYRLLLPVNTFLGVTPPVMALTGLLCILFERGKKLCLKRS